MKFVLVESLFGPLKCDVFGRLKNSVRNVRLARSFIANVRLMLRSVFQTPGRRNILRPLVPKRTSVTGTNAVGS